MGRENIRCGIWDICKILKTLVIHIKSYWQSNLLGNFHVANCQPKGHISKYIIGLVYMYHCKDIHVDYQGEKIIPE